MSQRDKIAASPQMYMIRNAVVQKYPSPYPSDLQVPLWVLNQVSEVEYIITK